MTYADWYETGRYFAKEYKMGLEDALKYACAGMEGLDRHINGDDDRTKEIMDAVARLSEATNDTKTYRIDPLFWAIKSLGIAAGIADYHRETK